jgi:hypothetical protein
VRTQLAAGVVAGWYKPVQWAFGGDLLHHPVRIAFAYLYAYIRCELGRGGAVMMACRVTGLVQEPATVGDKHFFVHPMYKNLYIGCTKNAAIESGTGASQRCVPKLDSAKLKFFWRNWEYKLTS